MLERRAARAREASRLIKGHAWPIATLAASSTSNGSASPTCANFVRSTILNVSPCSLQQTRSSQAGEETISNSLMRKGATLSSSNVTDESDNSVDMTLGPSSDAPAFSHTRRRPWKLWRGFGRASTGAPQVEVRQVRKWVLFEA